LFSSARDILPGHDRTEGGSMNTLSSAVPEVEIPPICGPGKPDVLITVQEPPSLDSLSCTSCSARGSPHIAYQRSNVDKWGSLFFWIYVRTTGKHILVLTSVTVPSLSVRIRNTHRKRRPHLRFNSEGKQFNCAGRTTEGIRSGRVDWRSNSTCQRVRHAPDTSVTCCCRHS